MPFDLADRSRLPFPILGAPMAGGPSTPALVAAVSEAGGLGFLAAGYRSAAQVAGQIAEVSARTSRPFGVNVFVPPTLPRGWPSPELHDAVERYRDDLARDAAALGVGVPEPSWWDLEDDWEAKIALLTLVTRLPVVSFTFGVPPWEVVDDLHEAGTAVLVTVTTLEEARAAAGVGADALVVQGFDAGGHRGTHRVEDVPNALDHLALLPMLAEVGLPMVAAGGITTAGDVQRALAAGAVAVQVGTALLRTPEAGTSQAHRMVLSDPALTSSVSRAFSGRPGRCLRTRFVDDHDAQAPAAYPTVHRMTAPLREAAARQGQLGALAVWAGSGWRAAQEEPAAEVVRRLAGPLAEGGVARWSD